MSLWWSAVPAGLLTVIALWLGLVAAPRERERFIATARAQREAMADDRAAAIDRWLAGGVGNVRLLASYPTVAHLASGAAVAAVPPGIGTRVHLETLLDGFRTTKNYGAAAALAADLSVVGAAPAGYVPGSAALDLARRCVAGAAAAAEVLPGADGEPVVVFAAPILAGGGPDRVVGAALLTEDPRQWLYPYVGHHPLMSKTGETVLLQRARSDALFIAPLRHSAAKPLTLRVPLSTPGFGGAAALLGNERFGRYVDYRGVTFLGAPRALKNAPWGLVVKIDEAEVMAPFRRWLRDAVVLLLAFALAFGSLVYGLWRREGDRRALALERSKASLARLLDQANDAVFSVSADGRIVHANRRAETMYGYSRDELRDMPVTALRLPEERHLVPQALATVRSAGHHELTAEHVRKDRTSFPVEVSISYLGDAGDGGFLAIARDVSERRRAEARIERLNRMLRTISEVNQLIVRERDSDTLLAQACRTVVEMGGLALVWIGRLDAASSEVRPVASAGAAAEALAQISIRADDSERGRQPTGVACRERRPVVVNDWSTDESVAPPPPWARQADLHAVAAFPLEGGTFGPGSLTAYSREPGFFDAEITALLDELVADLAFALESIAVRNTLEQQDRLLRDVSRLAMIGGWELDLATGEGTWTEEVARIHGLDPAAQPNAALGLSFYAETSRPRIEAALRRAIDEGVPYDLELEFVALDGTRKWVRTVGLPVARDGRVVRLRGTFQDVTERKRVEDALVESERRYRELIQSANSAILRWRPDGTITFINEYAESFFGYRAGEILGRSVGILVPATDSSGSDLSTLVQSIARDPESHVNVVNENVCRDGSRVWMTWTNRAIRDGHGDVTEILAIGADLSEQKRVEVALQESRARLQAALASMTDAVFISDAEGRFVEFNDAFATFHRFATKAECATSLAEYPAIVEVFLPGGAPLPLEQWAVPRALRGETATNLEYTLRRRDTGATWVGNYAFAPIRDAGGRIVGSVVAGRDVTERKRAEAALLASERRLRRVYESGLLGIIYWNMDGGITDANDKFLEITGYTREDLTAGRIDWVEMTPPEYRYLDEASVVELRATGVNARPLEKEYVRRDGSRVPVLVAGAMLDEERRSGVAFVLDVTERRRAEQALRASEARYRNTLDAMLEGCQIIGADWRYLYVNDTAERHNRRPRAELMGRRYMDCWPGIEATEVFAVIRRCLEERRSDFLETEFAFPDGAVGWFELRIYPVPEGVVILSVDITERKHAEVTLHRLNEELERRVELRTAQLAAANRELEAFSYSVSHDLRSPLRAIDGFSRMLVEDQGPALDAEGHRIVGVIRDNTRRMGQLIDDLLSFSRVGRTELHRVPVDVAALVAAVFAEVAGEHERAAIDLVVGDLPPAVADPALLRQVWANLLANAVKFTARAERPRVEVSGWRDGDRHVYRVSDNGVGFDPAYAGKLFGVFQRLHSMREFPGTGVGLALVRRIVERHGGTVGAEGRLGEGATFTFALPGEQEES